MATQTAQVLSRNELARYEFINSVTSIRSLAELLVDYPSLESSERLRFLERMQKETDRLLHLMTELKLTPATVHARCVRGLPLQCPEFSTSEL